MESISSATLGGIAQLPPTHTDERRKLEIRHLVKMEEAEKVSSRSDRGQRPKLKAKKRESLRNRKVDHRENRKKPSRVPTGDSEEFSPRFLIKPLSIPTRTVVISRSETPPEIDFLDKEIRKIQRINSNWNAEYLGVCQVVDKRERETHTLECIINKVRQNPDGPTAQLYEKLELSLLNLEQRLKIQKNSLFIAKMHHRSQERLVAMVASLYDRLVAVKGKLVEKWISKEMGEAPSSEEDVKAIAKKMLYETYMQSAAGNFSRIEDLSLVKLRNLDALKDVQKIHFREALEDTQLVECSREAYKILRGIPLECHLKVPVETFVYRADSPVPMEGSR